MPLGTRRLPILLSGRAWQLHSNGDSQTLLYCADGGSGDVLGFANVFPSRVSWPKWNGKTKISCLHIAWIAVDEKHQGHGIGRDMIRSLAQQAIREGHQALYLLVDSRNQSAIGFYRHFGFREIVNAGVHLDPADGSTNIRLILLLDSDT